MRFHTGDVLVMEFDQQQLFLEEELHIQSLSVGPQAQKESNDGGRDQRDSSQRKLKIPRICQLLSFVPENIPQRPHIFWETLNIKQKVKSAWQPKEGGIAVSQRKGTPGATSVPPTRRTQRTEGGNWEVGWCGKTDEGTQMSYSRTRNREVLGKHGT